MENYKLGQLILLLQKSPMSSFSDIGEKLQISPSTAKKKYRSLKGDFGNEKIIHGVNGIIDLGKIGLENVTMKISIDNYENHNTFQILDNLAEIHPYTLYKTYYFGGTSGLFLQFSIPKKSQENISKLFSRIRNETTINDITLFIDPINEINTYPDIDRYINGKWKFNFDRWMTENTPEMEITKNTTISLLNRLLLEDIIILREMKIEARRKQVDIITSIQNNKNNMYSKNEIDLFNMDRRRQLSRRFEFIKQNKIISTFHLRYNLEKFRLFNQFLFMGVLKPDYSDMIVKKLQTIPPPFRSNFKIYDNNRFLWWINLPPELISSFSNFLYKICDKMELNMLDDKHTRTYPIWHRNFVTDKNGIYWKSSHTWMVDNPLNQLFNRNH